MKKFVDPQNQIERDEVLQGLSSAEIKRREEQRQEEEEKRRGKKVNLIPNSNREPDIGDNYLSAGHQLYGDAFSAIEDYRSLVHQEVDDNDLSENDEALISYLMLLQCQPERASMNEAIYSLLFGLFTAVFSSYYSYSFSSTFFTLDWSEFNKATGLSIDSKSFASFTGVVSLMANISVGTVSGTKSAYGLWYRSTHQRLMCDSTLKDLMYIAISLSAAVPNVIFIISVLLKKTSDPILPYFTGLIVLLNMAAQNWRGLDTNFGIGELEKQAAADRRKRLINYLIVAMNDPTQKEIDENNGVNQKEFLKTQLNSLSKGKLYLDEGESSWMWLGQALGYYTIFYSYSFFAAVESHDLTIFLPTTMAMLAPYVSALTIAIALAAAATKYLLLSKCSNRLFSGGTRKILQGNETIDQYSKQLFRIVAAALVLFSVGGACQIVYLYIPVLQSIPGTKLWCLMIGGVAALPINYSDMVSFCETAYVSVYEAYLRHYRNDNAFNIYKYGTTKNQFLQNMIKNIVQTSDRAILTQYANPEGVSAGAEGKVYCTGYGAHSLFRAAAHNVGNAKEKNKHNNFEVFKSYLGKSRRCTKERKEKKSITNEIGQEKRFTLFHDQVEINDGLHIPRFMALTETQLHAKSEVHIRPQQSYFDECVHAFLGA